MKPYIYGLIDPTTKQLRYVGQTAQGPSYPTTHWKRKRKRERKDHCHCWVRSVLASGMIPEIIILQEVEIENDLSEAEIFWIAYFKMIGCRLTNMTDGGEGTRGFASPAKGKKFSDEHKRKISDARKGIKPWNKGCKTAASHADAYAKSGEKQRLRKGTFSDETRRKISEASSRRAPWNKGIKSKQTVTKETREKLSASNSGKKRTPEMIMRYSNAKKLWWSKRKAASDKRVFKSALAQSF